MKTAVAYLRTSSRANVGADKDSDKRQRDAILAYAAVSGYVVTAEYYDDAVKGVDAVSDRPAFSDMLARMTDNGIQTILVENAGRFARDLIVQLTGFELLKAKGISLIAVDAPDYFLDDTPTAKFIRQVLGAAAELEKTMLVDKMRKARERKRREHGRCEGRHPPPPEAVALAKQLRASGYTLRDIGHALAMKGYSVILGKRYTGKPYDAGSVACMLRKGC